MSEDKKLTTDIEVESSENFSGKDVGDIKDIVLRQLQKTIIEGSKEMSGGGVKTRLVDGQVVQIAVQDQRQIFINHVEMLWDLVLPKVMENKKLMDDKLGDFEEQLKELNTQHKDRVDKARGFVKGKTKAQLYTPTSDTGNQINNNLRMANERTELDKLGLYRKKLKAVSFLLAKVKYFAEGDT